MTKKDSIHGTLFLGEGVKHDEIEVMLATALVEEIVNQAPLPADVGFSFFVVAPSGKSLFWLSDNRRDIVVAALKDLAARIESAYPPPPAERH